MAGDDAYRELMYYLHRAALLSDRVGERRFQARVGIGRAMFLVLRAIADADGATPSQQAIADHLSLTKGAVSRHVATAQHNRWLTITPSTISRRENALVLTPAGQKLVAKGRTVQGEFEALADMELAPDDVSAAIRTLKNICRLLQQEDQR